VRARLRRRRRLDPEHLDDRQLRGRRLRVPLGPAFYYAYSTGGSTVGSGLVDGKGQLLPEAGVVVSAWR
jgi:hypothetical protein